MIIEDRVIGPGHPPYIIAELSGNHSGSLQRAIMLMGVAAGAGADAVKFQAYTPDTITLDCDDPDFIIKDGPWKGRKLYELYQKAHTPFEWFPKLFRAAKDYGITAFASVFDRTSVDMLEELGCPAYKIASMEIVDLPLIEYVASKGKPVILSTGMASFDEINDAINALGSSVPYATLHCVSGYPAAIEEYNLSRMSLYSKIYGVSDHTLGWEIPVAATTMGASIIEKHVCFSRDSDIEDAGFSLEPEEFKKMCEAVKSIYAATKPGLIMSQIASEQFRRSLYVVEHMHEGDAFTEQNVRSIRPGYGMPPGDLQQVLGEVACCDIARGTALNWDMVKV